jgi:hypothetical protein
LKSNDVPHTSGPVLHPKLRDGVGFSSGARISETNRFHRTEAKRVSPATRDLLGRHASLEVRHLVELVAVVLIRRDECVEKRLVLLARERAVEIRATFACFAERFLVVARRLEDDRVVDRLA